MRTVSGIQALVGLALVALLVLSYFSDIHSISQKPLP
jgi:hypothetical protein